MGKDNPTGIELNTKLLFDTPTKYVVPYDPDEDMNTLWDIDNVLEKEYTLEELVQAYQTVLEIENVFGKGNLPTPSNITKESIKELERLIN